MPRNRPGPCHGALSPMPREVLLTESPEHLWQGTWGELRETTPWGACFHQGLPAPAGGGCPPGPCSVSVCLQELPYPVLSMPQPAQVLPPESQHLPSGPPEALCKVGTSPAFIWGVKGLGVLGAWSARCSRCWKHCWGWCEGGGHEGDGEVRAMVCSGVRRQPSHQKGQPACGRGRPASLSLLTAQPHSWPC